MPSEPNTYDSGDVVVCTCTFAVGGVATDPGTVSLEVQDPTGTKTTYTYAAAELTRSSAGVYTKQVPITMAGKWAYRWSSTGAAQGAEEHTFLVRRRLVSP